MIGPLIKLIKREIPVSAAFTQFHRECGSPSPHLEGGTGYPRPVGLAVHRKTSMRSWFSLYEEFSGTYRLKKVLGLSWGANAGKTHSQNCPFLSTRGAQQPRSILKYRTTRFTKTMIAGKLAEIHHLMFEERWSMQMSWNG